MSSSLSDRIERDLLHADRRNIERLFTDCAGSRKGIHELGQALETALEAIGNSWESGEASLSQVYVAGRLVEDMMASTFPTTREAQDDQPGIAIAVLEDFHMLGKRLVLTSMSVSGQKVIDYGRVTVDEAVEKVLQDDTRILLISTLMLRSALRVADLKSALERQKADTRLIVGGAPFRFDPELWREVGADAMGNSSSDAVRISSQILENLS